MSYMRMLEHRVRLGESRQVFGEKGGYDENESTTRTMPKLVPLTRVFFRCFKIGLGMPSGRSTVE
jgi:hypothetical protein